MALFDQKPIAAPDDQPEEIRKLVERINKLWAEADNFHKKYSDLWDRLGGLWRQYDDLRHNVAEAKSARYGDAKGVLLGGIREWGAHFHIPVIFAVIETVVPRALSRPPKIIGKPKDRAAIPHAPTQQDLINQQMRAGDYELKLLPTAKRGFKFGLGIQKTYWKEKVRTVTRYERVRRSLRYPSGLAALQSKIVDFRGPCSEDVDIYDARWDPDAKDVETCAYFFHRTWRGMAYIKRKVESGEWYPLDLEAIKKMSPGESRDSVWSGRREAAGLPSGDQNREEGKHEVWEFYEGDRVVVVLDRKIVVANDVTPFHHGQYPFHIFRPTLVEGEFVGMGDIEPLVQLSGELSTLRTQRRDAATIALYPPTFYQRGTIRRQDAKTGPGVWTPVQGDPKEVLYQPQLRDLPGSSYQEEESIQQNLDLVSGISEAVAGGVGEGAAETATGIQFRAAAAGARIGAKTKMLRIETILPEARQFQALNRQYLLEGETVRVDEPESVQSEPGKTYAFMDVSRECLDANVELDVEDQSTEPDNPVERLNNALSLYQALANNPAVKPDAPLKHLLTEYGVRDPENWIAEQNSVTPEAIGETLSTILTESGIPEEQAQQMTLQVIEAAGQLQNAEAMPEGAPDQSGANGSASESTPQEAAVR